MMDMMEDRKLTERESLELISQMIRNTQVKLEKNSGTIFLIWGYLTAFVTLLVWALLLLTGNYHVQWLWFLLPLVGCILTRLETKKEKKYRGVTTYVDRIVGYIWLVLGTVGFALSVFSIFSWIWDIRFPILFIITLIMGCGTTLTGLAIRFKPLVYAGVVCSVLSFIFPFLTWLYQMPLFALIFVIMMVVPGHILNNAGKKNSVE